MIGAIEILIIAVIFGIIYGRDAIDKTFKRFNFRRARDLLGTDADGNP
jgi:hypothetical protein